MPFIELIIYVHTYSFNAVEIAQSEIEVDLTLKLFPISNYFNIALNIDGAG